MNNSTEELLADKISNYTVLSGTRSYPSDVLDLARMCLADWICVCIGALDEPPGIHVENLVQGFMSRGPAATFRGAKLPPTLASLINGTLAHCLDYDDVHFPSLSHISAPTWAAVLALASEKNIIQQRLLECFITGFEIGSRLGSNGVGIALNDHGWHATGCIGRLAATVASAALLELESEKIKNAIAIVATQTSGLTASFGTDAKSLHSGKAAFDAVFSAQLALSGFRGGLNILEQPNGLINVLVPLNTPIMSIEDLENSWKIRENAIKPYACCGQTHAAIDASRYLNSKLGIDQIGNAVRVDVYAHPIASKVAALTKVKEPLAAKFSISYCCALGLLGYSANASDFKLERISQAEIIGLADKVFLHADRNLGVTSARVSVTFKNGSQSEKLITESLGNPGNPISWKDLKLKFMSLVEPRIGKRSYELFDLLRDFGGAKDIGTMWAVINSEGHD